MPTVDGQTFAYTPEGRQRAARARTTSESTRRPELEKVTSCPRRRPPDEAPPPEAAAGGLPPEILQELLRSLQSSASPPRPTVPVPGQQLTPRAIGGASPGMGPSPQPMGPAPQPMGPRRRLR